MPIDYYQYIQSGKWMSKKIAMYKTKKVCQLCGKKKHLIVHHLTYVRLGDEKLSDLVLICNDCHKNAHWRFWGLVKLPLVENALRWRFRELYFRYLVKRSLRFTFRLVHAII